MFPVLLGVISSVSEKQNSSIHATTSDELTYQATAFKDTLPPQLPPPYSLLPPPPHTVPLFFPLSSRKVLYFSYLSQLRVQIKHI